LGILGNLHSPQLCIKTFLQECAIFKIKNEINDVKWGFPAVMKFARKKGTYAKLMGKPRQPFWRSFW